MLRVCVVLAMLTAVARADDDVRMPAPPPPAKPTGVVTRPPKLVQAVAPDYPPAALAAGKTAKVKVRIHIDATGVVTAVEVVEHVGDGFDEAAVAAAMQYVFEPAEIDGKPAAITVETAINFVITQKPEEPEPELGKAPPPAHPGPPNHAGSMTAPVVLQGVALERGTRRKLAGVIVAIKELGIDAVTGDDGSFFFHGVPAGNYQLIAVDPRFDRLERPIAIGKREALEVRLWMRPKGGNPYETVVEGEREQLEVTKRTLQRQQLTNVPGTFGDPIRALQSLPGIARSPFGVGLLLVRGSNPQDTGIFLDGHEVPALFHFLGGPSIFNAEMLESIDFYPGGFPARFGRFHGGVVALESRSTASDGFHGSAKVDFLDSGGYARFPITDDLTVAVAGRRSYIDLLLPLVLPQPSSGETRIVTPVYDDYQLKVDYNLHANGHLSLLVVGSDDSLHVLDKDPNAMTSQDLNSAISFLEVIASYDRPLGGDLRLTLSPSWGRDTVTLAGAEAGATGPFTSLGVVNNDLSYRLRINGRLDKYLVLDTGLDMLSRVTSYTALLPDNNEIANPTGIDIPPSQILRGSQMLGIGAYIDLGIDVTRRLRLITSMRVDGYILDGEDRASIDPRLVARYKISDQWTAKAYVGQFSEPPQPEALDKRFGNPTVGLEHGYHFGLGYEFRPDHVWSFDGEAYFVDRRDRVVFTDDVVQNSDGTYSYLNFCNCEEERTYGFEVLIKRQITAHAFGWLSYTFSHSIQQRAGDSWAPTPFDQPHVLNAVASYKPGGGWEVGTRVQLASGRPDTPVIGATFDADSGSYVPVLGPTRSVRDPTFFQLDARVEHDWLYQRWSLGAYLDVINVLDRQNVEAIQYDYRYRQSSPITSYPILPTLGVRGTW
ncbi:MAG TPA: TonB family protein [Kofleriaceae bacterium]|nr:TonB family protein [Kofleriaceae bacterium]